MSGAPGRYWHTLGDGRIQCDLCPRRCVLSNDGQRSFCFVRQRQGAELVSTTYGRSTGLCIDPVEKKPLNHFLPGTPTLSFGTAGCNLACRFCQNWDISKSRRVESLCEVAPPADIARAAAARGCRSVAFTYNDPVVFAEYAMDTAIACHALGLRTVAVTAAYITAGARGDLFEHMDAANVDLKAFSPAFYKELCDGELAPVLDTLEWLVKETDVWVEVTTLLIPGHNDSDRELTAQCAWMADHLGLDVPVHFSAFHPDYHLRDIPRTPTGRLTRAKEIARAHGLRYVYTGNVHDPDGDTTFCPGCGEAVIGRRWYEIVSWDLNGSACGRCGHPIAGVFEACPGSWGSGRQRVELGP